MSELFASLFTDLVNSAISEFDSALQWILRGILKAENLIDTTGLAIITPDALANVYEFIYRFSCALLILKFLFKGFQIYILWRNGDADNSPQDMLLGGVQAVVMMIIFPSLYDMMVSITAFLADGIMTRLGLSLDGGSGFLPPTLGAFSLFILLVFIVYLVAALVLCVRLIRRGFELLVLRLGVPIACMGLIDSDLGLFKGYIQVLFKTLFTSVIQITLFSLSLRLAVTCTFINLLSGLAALGAAFSAPFLMQQMLVASGHGGGVTNKIYAGAMAAKAVRSLFRK